MERDAIIRTLAEQLAGSAGSNGTLTTLLNEFTQAYGELVNSRDVAF